MKDSDFASYFGVVLAVLIAITALVFIIANMLTEGFGKMDDAMVEATKERIAEVGQVNVGAVPVMASAEQSMTQADTPAMSPAKTYEAVCQACHVSGVLESPKLTDKAQWQTRMQQGIDALYTSAIQGKGNMPPKGGRLDLSDDVIKQAVDYMLEQAGIKK